MAKYSNGELEAKQIDSEGHTAVKMHVFSFIVLALLDGIRLGYENEERGTINSNTFV